MCNYIYWPGLLYKRLHTSYQNFNQIVLRSDFIYLDTKHIGFFFIAAQMERERTSLEQALEKLLDQKHI